MPLFSIILATRNRPQLFAEALESVTNQSCHSKEIIVVNDGSDDAHMSSYKKLIDMCGCGARLYSLVQRPNGHGQSYSLNYGVSKSLGEYVCFLDDDDKWIDRDYLSRLETAITHLNFTPDLIFSNQVAVLEGKQKPGPVWLDGLDEVLVRHGRIPEVEGLYKINLNELIEYGHFCHLNTLVARKDLYELVGGMDENIRWECDHDFYLRLVDQAEVMLLSPRIVSQHNIPDPIKRSSMTTMLDEIQRRIYQLRVFDKATLYGRHSIIQAYGRRHKGYTLKRIAILLAREKRFVTAAFYAKQAFGTLPTIKWFIYTGYLMIRAAHYR